jgi:hypothetical protein
LLPDQLVQPLPAERAEALVIDVGAVVRPGRRAVDQHLEPDGGPALGRSHSRWMIISDCWYSPSPK